MGSNSELRDLRAESRQFVLNIAQYSTNLGVPLTQALIACVIINEEGRILSVVQRELTHAKN
jgi:hypothetical protein